MTALTEADQVSPQGRGAHTPGWHWVCTDMGRRPHRWELRDAGGTVILETLGVELAAKDKYTRLIATSTDLLASAKCDEALNSPVVDWKTLKQHGWVPGESGRDFCQRLRRAAIAKATGTQP